MTSMRLVGSVAMLARLARSAVVLARSAVVLARVVVLARSAVVLAGAACLVGCGTSPPTRFYSLAPEPPSSAEASQSGVAPSGTTTSEGVPVRVGAVHIPPILDRREIVRSGPGERLELSGVVLWGAPVDEMVQQVLTQNLIERLPAGKVVLPAGPAPTGTETIVVDLLQFQSDTEGTVVLQGSWSLLAPAAGSPAFVHDFRYEQSAGAQDYGGEAAVMSRLLGRLADDIAHEVRNRP